MSDSVTNRCRAMTKAGAQCKNGAQEGKAYCFVHRAQEEATSPPSTSETSAEDAGSSGVKSRPEFQELVAELNDLAEELRRIIPEYSPPAFSQEGLLRLLRENVDRMTPEMRLDFLRSLQSGLENTSPRDFFDPDTWKGLWYLFNYSLQAEAAVIKEKLAGRLSTMPGATALTDFQGMLQGASAKDLLELETWKGMWYLLNYTIQGQIDEVKRRVRGEEGEEEA